MHIHSKAKSYYEGCHDAQVKRQLTKTQIQQDEWNLITEKKKTLLGSVNTNNSSEDKARWQRAAECWYPEELSTAADPFKQNGDNETIRPKLVSSIPV